MQPRKPKPVVSRDDDLLRFYGIPKTIAGAATVRYEHEGQVVEAGLEQFLTALRQTIVSL